MKRLITMMLVIGIAAMTGRVFCQDNTKVVTATTSKPVLSITKTDTISKLVPRKHPDEIDTLQLSGVDGAEKAAAPVKEEAAKVEKAEEKPPKPKTEPKEVKK